MNKKTIFISWFCGLFIVIACNKGYSQPEKGNIGISTTIQDTQLDLIIPIWINNNMVIAPSLGYLSARDKANDMCMNFAFRYYIKKTKASPYLAMKGGLLRYTIDNEIIKEKNSVTDYIIGFCFGGEYFWNSNFSIGNEIQINCTFSDKLSNRFGNPGGTNINTASVLFVTIYF